MQTNGHTYRCRYKKIVNRPNDNLVKPICKKRLASGELCARNISRQACKMSLRGNSLCPSHWKNLCKVSDWDPELSQCANEICDFLLISLVERADINQFNIEDTLDIPSSYHHISDKRIRREKERRKRELREIREIAENLRQILRQVINRYVDGLEREQLLQKYYN